MATVISHRNIIIPAPDGSAAFNLPKGYIGSVPKWVEETRYFRGLVKDGKVSVSESTKDNDLEKADEAAKAAEEKARAAAKATAEKSKAEQEAKEAEDSDEAAKATETKKK